MKIVTTDNINYKDGVIKVNELKMIIQESRKVDEIQEENRKLTENLLAREEEIKKVTIFILF